MTVRHPIGGKVELALVPRIRQAPGLIAVSTSDGRQALPQFRAASHIETG